jgi:ribosomal protein L13
MVLVEAQEEARSVVVEPVEVVEEALRGMVPDTHMRTRAWLKLNLETWALMILLEGQQME